MAQTERQEQTDIIERGNIYFAYQPKVREKESIKGIRENEEEAPVEGFEDVQRFYMVLSPHGKQRYRLLVIGHKQLPETSSKTKNWGFVDKVGREAKDIEKELRYETYETKTRGERVSPAARPAAEGVYAIIRHKDHTHLAYALELPDSPRAVQKALNIEEEGSYILNVKNPEQSSSRQTGLSEERKADFPKRLQERFEGRRFISADPVDFLDYEGAEILLIGAAEDVYEELGVRLDPQQEDEHTAEIFNDLRMVKSRHPVKPLFEGEWE